MLHSEYEKKHYQLNFLLENEKIFSDTLSVTQDIFKKLEECSEIKGAQKKVGTVSFVCYISVLRVPDPFPMWDRNMKTQNISIPMFFRL